MLCLILHDWHSQWMVIPPFRVYQAHAKNGTEMYLSDDSKIILCQVLCNEIQVYKSIIRRAINFNHADVSLTMEEFRQTCPREAAEETTTCSEALPDFSRRIERARGELLDLPNLQ